MRRLFSWAKECADRVTYGFSPTGSFNAKFADLSPKSVFGCTTRGQLNLNFGWLSEGEEGRAWGRSFGDALRAVGRLSIFEVIARAEANRFVAMIHQLVSQDGVDRPCLNLARIEGVEQANDARGPRH